MVRARAEARGRCDAAAQVGYAPNGEAGEGEGEVVLPESDMRELIKDISTRPGGKDVEALLLQAGAARRGGRPASACGEAAGR
jgi:hypothetical protein